MIFLLKFLLSAGLRFWSCSSCCHCMQESHKAAPQSCALKLLPKAAPHSKLQFEAAVQNCSCPRSCSPNLLHKAVPQSRSPKLLSKAAPNSCSPKLLQLPPKIVSESCFPKLLPKATQQSCRSSKQLFINAPAKPQSCSPQLLPKAALQSCYHKPRPKEAPQNSANRLRKQAPCSKRAVSQRCVLERAQRQ